MLLTLIFPLSVVFIMLLSHKKFFRCIETFQPISLFAWYFLIFVLCINLFFGNSLKMILLRKVWWCLRIYAIDLTLCFFCFGLPPFCLRYIIYNCSMSLNNVRVQSNVFGAFPTWMTLVNCSIECMTHNWGAILYEKRTYRCFK